MEQQTEKYLYEEYGKISTVQGWGVVIGLVVFLIVTGFYVMLLLPDRERHWDYGAVNSIPGGSVYSSMSPDPGPVAPAETLKVPQQLAPPPGARPLEKLPPIGYERGN